MLNAIDNKEVQLFQDKKIMQHNVITSARYDFSACMLDVFFMLLAYTEKNKRTYRVHTKDIEVITGRKWNYAQLKETTEQIGSRMYEIETENTYTQLWLFSEIKYMKNTGSFEVTINDKALPYFFDLKNQFTVLHLKSVLLCSSKYAKRLYAIACQWRNVHEKTFTIKELKDKLGLIDKKTGIEQYKKISLFKKYILEVAKQQINGSTDIDFDYELIKKSRSFEYIKIYIDEKKTKEALRNQIDFNKPISRQIFYKNLLRDKFSKEQALQISTNMTYEEFRGLMKKLDVQLTKNKTKIKANAIAYIVGVLKQKGIVE